MTHQVTLGKMTLTKAAMNVLDKRDMMEAIGRHYVGDWGDLAPEDQQVNEEAVRSGGGLLSAYRDRNGTRFFIITEADRSATTVLLPEDY